MSISRTSLPIVAFAVLVLIPIADSNAQADREGANSLQGSWRVVAMKDKVGSAEVEKKFLSQIWKFEGESISIYYEKQDKDRLINEMVFVLNAKMPLEIDLFAVKKGKKAPVPLLGIFAFDKDKKLQLTWSKREGKDRPTAFKVDANDKQVRQISILLEKVRTTK